MGDQKLFTGADIPEHPLLTKLFAEGAANLTTLVGYVGPSPTEGKIRLHPSLDNLSEYVEINRRDIHHAMDAPEAEAPQGGIKVWLQEGANVEFHRVETTEAVAKADASLFEVTRGRLRIKVGDRLRADVCQSRCQVCTSRCKVCQSRCSAGRLRDVFTTPGFNDRVIGGR